MREELYTTTLEGNCLAGMSLVVSEKMTQVTIGRRITELNGQWAGPVYGY